MSHFRKISTGTYYAWDDKVFQVTNFHIISMDSDAIFFRYARHHGLNGSLRSMGYSIWRKTRWGGPVKMGRIPTYLIWLETMLNGKRYLWLTLNIRKVILAQLLLFLAFKFVLILRPPFLHANFNRDIIENTQSVPLCLFSVIMNTSLLAVTTVVQLSFFFSYFFRYRRLCWKGFSLV